MKRSRFSEEQIAYALLLADSETPVVEALDQLPLEQRQHVLSDVTFRLAYMKLPTQPNG